MILLRTELLKACTTRAPRLLAAASVALTATMALQAVLEAGRQGSPSIGTAGAMLAVLGAMAPGAVAALLLGALLVTTEFRHQTVTATLLAAPRRARLLAAKAVAGLLAGLLLGCAGLVVALAVGLPSGALRADLVGTDVALRGLGLLLTYPLYGLLGVGLGALLDAYQPLVMLLPVVWLLGLEKLLLRWLPRPVGGWSLGNATAALQNSGTIPRLLPVWLGLAAVLVWGVALLATGGARFIRRDVT